MELREFTYCVEDLRSNLLKQAMHYLNDADDAEDAVQDTLVKLWIVNDRISDSSKLRNLATVICKNVCLNLLRNHKQSLPIEDAGTVAEYGNPQKELEEHENISQLELCIKALPDKQRAILKFRNVDNMSYTDIAKIMATTESSVRGMISKARMQLLKNMKGTAL